MIIDYRIENGHGDWINLVIQGKDRAETDEFANERIEQMNIAHNKRFPPVNDPKYDSYVVIKDATNDTFMCVEYYDHEIGML